MALDSTALGMTLGPGQPPLLPSRPLACPGSSRLLVGDDGEEGRVTGGDEDFWLKMFTRALSIGKMLLAEG